MVTIEMGGLVKVPLSCLDSQLVIKKLTYKSYFKDRTGKKKHIKLYNIDQDFIYVPREWARKNLPQLIKDKIFCVNTWKDETINFGYTKLPDPYHPSVLDKENQKTFMDDMLHKAKQYKNILCVAKTGSGKTMVALRTVALLSKPTLVLVNTNALKEQWFERIEQALGIEKKDVGVIQASKLNYKNKSITIGLLQTFAKKKLPQEVYDYFSIIVIDECHNLSTEFFSQVVPMFRAKYRIGLSATPKRKDGSDRVLYDHIGKPRVVADTKIMDCDVIVKPLTIFNKWGKTEEARISCYIRSNTRNKFLADTIVDMYNDKRKILAISLSVDHLDKIYDLLIKKIPPEEISYYTGTINVGGKRKKMTPEQHKETEKKQIILATYGIFKEAVDIPALDAGIELTPTYKGNQLIGRVRRYVEGKKKPYWVSIYDTNCKFSDKMYHSRYAEWIQAGANVINS